MSKHEPTQAQLDARLSPTSFTVQLPTEGLFLGDDDGQILKRVGDNVLRIDLVDLLIPDHEERRRIGNFGAQMAEAKKRFQIQFGIDLSTLPRVNLGDFTSSIEALGGTFTISTNINDFLGVDVAQLRTEQLNTEQNKLASDAKIAEAQKATEAQLGTGGSTGGGIQPPTVDLQPNQVYSKDVEQLQNYLIQEGYMTKEEQAGGEGFYGAKTTNAVRKMQEALGVDNSTGVGFYGKLTKAGIEKAASSAGTPTFEGIQQGVDDATKVAGDIRTGVDNLIDQKALDFAKQNPPDTEGTFKTQPFGDPVKLAGDAPKLPAGGTPPTAPSLGGTPPAPPAPGGGAPLPSAPNLGGALPSAPAGGGSLPSAPAGGAPLPSAPNLSGGQPSGNILPTANQGNTQLSLSQTNEQFAAATQGQQGVQEGSQGFQGQAQTQQTVGGVVDRQALLSDINSQAQTDQEFEATTIQESNIDVRDSTELIGKLEDLFEANPRPEEVNLVQTFQQQRAALGLDVLENSMVGIDSQIAELDAAFSSQLDTEAGQQLSLAAIQRRQSNVGSEYEKQKRDLLVEKGIIVDQLNMQYATLNTIVNLTGQDYQNSQQRYQFEFSAAMQTIDLFRALGNDQFQQEFALQQQEDLQGQRSISNRLNLAQFESAEEQRFFDNQFRLFLTQKDLEQQDFDNEMRLFAAGQSQFQQEFANAVTLFQLNQGTEQQGFQNEVTLFQLGDQQQQQEFENNFKVFLAENDLSQQDFTNQLATFDREQSQGQQDFSNQLALYQTELGQDNRVADNARANLQVIYNTLASSKIDFGTLDAATKADIAKMELQAGFPRGFTESIPTFANNANDKLIATNNRNVGGIDKTDLMFMGADGEVYSTTVTHGQDDSGSGGDSTYTSNGIKLPNTELQDITTGLANASGTDGYTDPNLYLAYYNEWVRLGMAGKDFISKFPPNNYINPVNKTLPVFLQSTKGGSGSSSTQDLITTTLQNALSTPPTN